MHSIQPLHGDEVTPKSLYINRREFLRAMGITSAALLLAACDPIRNRKMGRKRSAQLS